MCSFAAWLCLERYFNGVRKSGYVPRPKISLLTKQVATIIKAAVLAGEEEVAVMIAVSRLFLLRVPSEAVRLEWDGSHSQVWVGTDEAIINLMRRKNSNIPVQLERHCCCKASGKSLCAVHWLQKWQSRRARGTRLFSLSAATFLNRVRSFDSQSQIPDAQKVGTHAFRRGMAQDIVSSGGSLAVLLNAGGWNSKTVFTYLRQSQVEDSAVAQLIINVSDSEAEA